MDPRWWHYTKIAMYHVPILERGGNVSHNPRLSTVVLMLGMTLCALFSAKPTFDKRRAMAILVFTFKIHSLELRPTASKAWLSD